MKNKSKQRDNLDPSLSFNPAEFEPDFEERLPRRFVEALNPPKIVTKRERKAKEEQDSKHKTPEEEWVQVRPGETFPQYNKRMKDGGEAFTVPPKTIQTTPGFEGATVRSLGGGRRERRNEYLRGRKREKQDKDTLVSGKGQKRPLGETVKEPARITSKPKEAFKANNRRHGKPSHTIDLKGNNRIEGMLDGDRQRTGKHDRRPMNTEKRRKPFKGKRYFELVKSEQARQ